MTKFLWCSAHKPTAEQTNELLAKGELYFLSDVDSEMQDSLNNCPANRASLSRLALDLSYKTGEYIIVQPGGSPIFQFMLGLMSEQFGTDSRIIYAHSERVSVDTAQPDGTVVKTSVFKHLGFI